MAIIRTVPLKDATSTAMTSCGVGTAYDVGGMFSGQKLYGGLHILSSSTGALVVRIQGSSSSHIAFTSQTSLGAQWATPLTTGSVATTFRKFWRAEWGMTTSGESYRFLPWMGIQ